MCDNNFKKGCRMQDAAGGRMGERNAVGRRINCYLRTSERLMGVSA